jgi:hypothetical protein
VNAEIEPFVAVNPTNARNLIGVVQQDRWSNGGSHGLITMSSFDGGATWATSFPHFSTCAGGTAANGGNYDRSSGPWVSIGPDGTAYQVSLSASADQTLSAILARPPLMTASPGASRPPSSATSRPTTSSSTTSHR